ncbi:MAG TPA: hemerythrin domain-containing protein, partial [Solirubrobacteraceae bacterium]
INGSFGDGEGFLRGSPSDWAQRLAALTGQAGISTFLLMGDDEETLRTFAQEVVPAVRELVEMRREEEATAGRPAGEARPGGEPAGEAGRVGETGGAATTAGAARGDAAGAAFTLEPTAEEGARLRAELPWDESSRPAGPPRDPQRRYTPEQLATGRHLIDVHDALRAELGRLREIVAQVGAGNADPAALRSFFNRMTIRQNNWTLGAFCESYCRAVTVHHTIEDRSVFPHLARADERLQGVLDRLQEEHEAIAEILERADSALVALVAGEADAISGVRAAVDLIADAMGSHFSYEERELIEPLARLGFQ